MAQNFIESGDRLDYTIPSGVTITSGQGVLVGKLLGVALGSGTEGQVVTLAFEGVFVLPKASGAITHGAALYWDDTNKVLTTTASGNTLCSHAWKAAASGDTTVQARLYA